jgi:hypothetical protein
MVHHPTFFNFRNESTVKQLEDSIFSLHRDDVDFLAEHMCMRPKPYIAAYRNQLTRLNNPFLELATPRCVTHHVTLVYANTRRTSPTL